MSDNLYLFANNNGGQAEENGSYRLYDLKIEGDPEGVDSGVNYVDYLEGDGASWIDTNIMPNFSMSFYCDYTLDSYNTVAFGAGESIRSYGVYQTTNRVVYGGIENLSFKELKYGDRYINLLTPKGYEVTDITDGRNVKGNYSFTPSGNINRNMTLFAELRSVDGVAQSIGRQKIYEFKILNGNVLIMHLRPCLDTKGVPCMYDEVSKKYFYNKGTGTFKYKKTLRDFQPVLDSNNIPCLLDKIKNKFYYNKSGEVFKTKEKVVKKLPFIKTDGASYIDTGLKPSSIIGGTLEIKCGSVEWGSAWNSIAVFGCGRGADTGDTPNFGVWNNYVRQFKGFETTENTKDGENVIYKGTNINASVEKNIYIGAINGNNGAYYGSTNANFPIYYFKIWNSEGTLIQHLIPILDENNNVGMYDKVSDQFFYNQGTGTFGYEIEELEVQDENYTEIEYIESNGTQYIDTGLVPNSNTNIDMTCRSTKNYSPIEYIEGTGTQYINTGIVPTLNTKVEFTVNMTYTNTYARIFGSNKFMNLSYQTTEDWANVQKYGNTYSHGSNSIKYYVGKHTYVINMSDTTNLITIDGTNFEKSQTVTSNSTENPLYLLCGWNDSASTVSSAIGSGKIYGCKIYESDALVFDGIPVLDTNNVPCMYDKVTGALFYSESSDAFIGGQGIADNFIINGLAIKNNTYQYNDTDTTVQPNLVASEGATLTMGSTNLALLDDEDIETATNNGWNLV